MVQHVSFGLGTRLRFELYLVVFLMLVRIVALVLLVVGE